MLLHCCPCGHSDVEGPAVADNLGLNALVNVVALVASCSELSRVETAKSTSRGVTLPSSSSRVEPFGGAVAGTVDLVESAAMLALTPSAPLSHTDRRCLQRASSGHGST